MQGKNMKNQIQRNETNRTNNLLHVFHLFLIQIHNILQWTVSSTVRCKNDKPPVTVQRDAHPRLIKSLIVLLFLKAP